MGPFTKIKGGGDFFERQMSVVSLVLNILLRLGSYSFGVNIKKLIFCIPMIDSNNGLYVQQNLAWKDDSTQKQIVICT